MRAVQGGIRRAMAALLAAWLAAFATSREAHAARVPAEVRSPTMWMTYDAGRGSLPVPIGFLVDKAGPWTGPRVKPTYDAVPHLCGRAMCRFHVVLWTYELANRVLTERNGLNLGPTYTYDAAGRRFPKLDANGQSTCP